MYQEVGSAAFCQLSGQKQQCLLWYRFQRDVHLSAEVLNDDHINKILHNGSSFY